MEQDDKIEGQWEADPNGKLNVPQKIKSKMRFKLVYSMGTSTMFGYCRTFSAKIGGKVTVKDALVDTSDRYSGITMRKRFTYHAVLHFVNAPLQFIPLSKSEI